MHKIWNILAAGVVLLGTAAAQQTTTPATPPAKPKTAAGTSTTHKSTTAARAKLPLVTEKDKQSYAIGLSVGKNLSHDSIDVEPKFVLQGLQDALGNGKLMLTDDQIKTVMTALQASVKQKQEAKQVAASATNKKTGTAYLAANGAKPGVVTLPDGLQYKILTPGTGPKPAATDSVICNYRGTLVDGTEFDSSYKRGQPATFPVNRVIKGWTEALQLMPVGSKWQLVIPSDLAYGEHGQGPIGPASTLIFEVELMSIQPKPAAEAAAPATGAPAAAKPATTVTPPASSAPAATVPPPATNH